jgi:hypothetical protein
LHTIDSVLNPFPSVLSSSPLRIELLCVNTKAPHHDTLNHLRQEGPGNAHQSRIKADSHEHTRLVALPGVVPPQFKDER